MRSLLKLPAAPQASRDEDEGRKSRRRRMRRSLLKLPAAPPTSRNEEKEDDEEESSKVTSRPPNVQE